MADVSDGASGADNAEAGDGTGSVAQLTLRGPADQGFAERVLDALERFLSAAVSDDERFRFMLAVSEVVTNVVQHGGGDADIEIEFRSSPVSLTAHIRDTAAPAEIDLSDVSMPDASAESGRGLSLALTVLDEFLHEASATGNTWQLHLQLGGADAAG